MSNYTFPGPPTANVYKMPDGTYHYVFSTSDLAQEFSKMCHEDLQIGNGNKCRDPLPNAGYFTIQLSPDENVSVNTKLRKLGKHPPHMFTSRVTDAAYYINQERLSKPYTNDKNPPGRSQWELTLSNGKKVFRPNHGLAHSVRAACFVPYVVDYLKKYYHPIIPPDMFTPERIELIQIAMLFSVAGRENEAGFIPPNDPKAQLIANDYFSYRRQSADLFENYCREKGLITDPNELKLFKDLLFSMGDPSINHPIYHAINIAHKLDLFRCYGPDMNKHSIENHVRNLSDPPDNKDLSELMRFAANCIKATGNRLLTNVDPKGQLISASSKYTNTFYECSTNVQSCLSHIEKVKPPSFTKKVSIDRSPEDLSAPYSLPKLTSVVKEQDLYILHFPSKQKAQMFLDRMHQRGQLTNIDGINNEKEGIGSTVSVSHQQFNQIKPLLKYHVIEPPKHYTSEANLFDENGEIRALSIIQKGDGLIKTVNSTPLVNYDKPDYDWYLDQLNNPAEKRPVPRHHIRGDRDVILDQRTQQQVRRSVRNAPLRLSVQIPTISNPRASDFFDAQGNPIPRAIQEKRGTEKNTIFTKKSSHSLLRPDGKIEHFPGVAQTQSQYLPIGLLSDVNEVNTYGERYIWRKNVASYFKFWVGHAALDAGNINPTNASIAERGKGISLDQLRTELQNDVRDNPNSSPKWNELLVGGSKTAVKALYATDDSLVHRLNLLEHYIRIREKHGIDVPLIILDGKASPKMYTEAMIKEDLKETASLLNQKKFPYLKNKDHYTQQRMLLSLFRGLTKPNSVHNLERIPHDEININKMLINLDIVGGKNREMKYMLKQWKKGLHAQKACFMRACQLGHIDIIKRMLKKGFDVREIVNEATGDTALHIAVKNKQYDIVELLLKKNAHIDTKNNDNLTPLMIAQGLNEPLMVTTLETRQYIKPPQIDLSNYVVMAYKNLGKQDFFLSKTWFAHKFSNVERGDQKEFLQLIADRHLAKAIGGHTEDAMMLATALDMIEQSISKGGSVTNASSRLQTIINDLKERMGPVELTIDDKKQHAEKIKGLLSRRKLDSIFQVYMSKYDPTLVASRMLPSYPPRAR